jgi:Bifunctional DNA primase/polymerase, N-terminal
MNPCAYDPKWPETSESEFRVEIDRNTLESLHDVGGFGLEPPPGENASDLDRLLAAMRAHPWLVVPCRRRAKRPSAIAPGDPWLVTNDPGQIREWVGDGNNVGLMAGEAFRLAIIEVDDASGFADLCRVLGPLGTPTVSTARGRAHHYVAWEPGIPGTLIGLHGEVIGEPRRGGVVAGQDPEPQQMAVAPPSYVVDRAKGIDGPYRWADGFDPTAPLPQLPAPWRRYFARMTRPRPPHRPGPPLPADARQALVAAALRQPGARQRGDDVKFQCPGCAALGRDTAQDNARLFTATSRWGCAVFSYGVPGSRDHWRAIGHALGAFASPTGVRR